MFKDKKNFNIKHNMECAICLEEGKLILFNHNGECGNINVHDSCLTKWFLNNNNECIICRKNLVNDYELLVSEEENNEQDIEENQITTMDIIINNNNINDNIKIFFKIFAIIIFVFFLIYFLILTSYK